MNHTVSTAAVSLIVWLLALASGQECEKSETTVNDVQVCKGAEIFKETFPTTELNLKKWQYVVKISGNEEYEFVVYDKNERNCYIERTKLIFAPSILPDELVRKGKLELQGCTGVAGTVDCEKQALLYNINPPVQSAQVNTKHAFSFRYGKVNIRAKLPSGDWIVPQLLLKPKEEAYGSQYKSGAIRIALVKGNENLICEGKNLGKNYLESGVVMGTGERVKGRAIARTTAKDPWAAKWHNYTVVWKPDGISFFVDGRQEQDLLPLGVKKMSDAVGFTSEESSIWSQGTTLAPFDKEFYIALGISVGGMREFPDDCTSNGRKKPWNNFEVKGMLKFWQDRAHWERTWNEDSRLQIENIVVTAL